jgi:hypothetical protein
MTGQGMRIPPELEPEDLYSEIRNAAGKYHMVHQLPYN